MKRKILIISVFLLAIFFMTNPASAWDRGHHFGHHHSSFGLFLSVPFVVGPPAYYPYYYPPAYYPPPPPVYYYGPSYYDRAWVPGHWEERYGDNGWDRVWVPGYWRY